MDNLLTLISENKIIKFIAPKEYEKTKVLVNELANKGYNTVVILSNISNISNISDKNVLNNVSYMDSNNYLNSSIKSDILIIDEIHDNFINNLMVIGKWAKEGNKLVISSIFSIPAFLFETSPSYIIKNNLNIQIRYTNDIPLDNYVDFLFEIVNKLNNSSISGNFLIYALEKDVNIIRENFSHINNRKIIVSHNPYELELKDFSCIFDSMIEERNQITLTGGVRKGIDYISKEDAEIRSLISAKDVIVYRLISKETFDILPSHSQYFDIPLHHIMIDIYEKNLNPFEVLKAILDTNLKEQMYKIYSLFLNYGIIDMSLKLMSKAKLLRKISFGLKPALLYLETGDVVFSSLLDNYNSSPFLFSVFNNVQSASDYSIDSELHIKNYYNRFRGESDADTLLNVYEIFLQEVNEDLYEWCRQNDISYDYMKNVYKSIENNKIYQSQLSSPLKTLTSAISLLYEDQKMSLNLQRDIFTQYFDKNGKFYSIDSLSINSIEERRPKFLYALITSVVAEFQSISFSYIPPK